MLCFRHCFAVDRAAQPLLYYRHRPLRPQKAALVFPPVASSTLLLVSPPAWTSRFLPWSIRGENRLELADFWYYFWLKWSTFIWLNFVPNRVKSDNFCNYGLACFLLFILTSLFSLFYEFFIKNKKEKTFWYCKVIEELVLIIKKKEKKYKLSKISSYKILKQN